MGQIRNRGGKEKNCPECGTKMELWDQTPEGPDEMGVTFRGAADIVTFWRCPNRECSHMEPYGADAKGGA